MFYFNHNDDPNSSVRFLKLLLIIAFHTWCVERFRVKRVKFIPIFNVTKRVTRCVTQGRGRV